MSAVINTIFYKKLLNKKTGLNCQKWETCNAVIKKLSAMESIFKKLSERVKA